jgi:hypothetical protein
LDEIERDCSPPQAEQAPIVKGRVLFLSPREAIRHHLRRAEPLIWLFLMLGLIGASFAAGF